MTSLSRILKLSLLTVLPRGLFCPALPESPDNLLDRGMLTGLLEAVTPFKEELLLCLVADVIFPRSSDSFAVGIEWVEETLLFLSLAPFDPPNQRRLRAFEDVDGARLTVSASAVEASGFPGSLFLLFSISCANAWVKADGGSRDVPSGLISTSSASRHHFLRRV